MQLDRLVSLCSADRCPSVYLDGTDVVVQGYPELLSGLPEGEAAVRIPGQIFMKAAKIMESASLHVGG
jgi:hypothetical protein